MLIHSKQLGIEGDGMLLSSKGRYGLKAMIDIAVNGKEKPVSIKQISKRQGISESYLEQIISVLKKAGLVKSIRGTQGGYQLFLTPSNISVGDIIRPLEGSVSPSECVDENSESCSNDRNCMIRYVLEKIKIGIDDVVNNITLEDMMQEVAGKND